MRQRIYNYHTSLARAVPIACLRAADATGTALSTTQQESVMSQNSNLGSFQYMVDVGVPQEDVAWLRRIAGTPGARLTDAAARIRKIQDQAFEGLLSASAPVHRVACR
jgi:isocitrate dehydrogenase kinase/phosphatase